MEEEQKKVSGAAALPKVGWKGMLALAFGILFFAGVFATVQGAEWLKAFDYSTLIGKFGTMKDPAKATFVGMGGVSARGGFIFALSLIPSVMLAIGVVDVLDHYGALSAAQKLMTPLFKPLMDVPGLVGLALITDLQSTDAGALFGFILCPIILPLIIIMVMKFVGAMICRFALDTIYKGDFKNDN